MKILLVNKFLYPKGGSETYVIKLGQILQDHGHEVQYFGIADERNTVGNRVQAYARPRDFKAGVKANLTAPLSIIYNADARRKIRMVLDDFEPDVVHLNNIQFHLTPSIILECHQYRKQTGRKLRIVYTAHDYQLVCPAHGLFDSRLNICEKCIGGHYGHCLRNKCVKNSYSKSLLGMLDAIFWKHCKAYSYIDTIICCSRFLKSRLDNEARYASKTIAIHNFVDPVETRTVEREGYVLEFGHLSRDKGTFTVLEVAKRMPDVQFVFAGFGAAVDAIQAQPNAKYVGFQSGEALEMLIRKAAVTVLPSECYENCPFTAIESQMYLTPVIGSDRGGTPELIECGRTGEVFRAGDADDLEAKLRKVLFEPGVLETYARNCRDYQFETRDSYYQKLMAVYGDE